MYSFCGAYIFGILTTAVLFCSSAADSTPEEILKAGQANQHVFHMNKGPYSLSQLLNDMSDLKLSDLNVYRGPILSHLGMLLMNISNPHEPESVHRTFHVWKHTCQHLYTKALNSVNGTWPPPKEPPAEMRRYYTLDERIPIFDFYIDSEHYNGGSGYVWGKDLIEKLRAQPKCNCAQYGLPNCDAALAKYEHFIRNKAGIVIGSETPWAEAVLLKYGATHVSTIEYMPIKTDHPQLTAYHPADIATQYLLHKWEEVDFAFSFSSIEHDGLGRYGDPLGPFADLESIARARCLLKQGGVLFLGFPTGPDALSWNAHRIYGRLRLFLMFQGFEPIDMVGMDHSVMDNSTLGFWRSQPMFILRKI